MPDKSVEPTAEVSDLYAGRVRVEFRPDAKRHRYVVIVDGEKTKPPSVTQISSVYDKSPALMNWAINSTLDVVREAICPGREYSTEDLETIYVRARQQSNWLKQKAADIGTLTHAWLFRWVKGEVKDLPPKNAVWRPCVDASLAFIEEHHVKFLNVEQAIYSLQHGYSGRMDADAEIDGELGLIDWKSGNGVHFEAIVQSSAYDFAREEELGLKYANRYVIRLGKETGQFYQHKLPRETRDRDFEAFLGLKQAFHAEKLISKQLRKDKKEHEATKNDWLDELVER